MLAHTLFSALIITSACATLAHAQTPEERGLEIATLVDAQNDGFIDSSSAMTMTLINRAGKKSLRKMRAMNLETDGDGDKSMSIFETPADVKGTASLTFSHSQKPDEQWLYLPALKRVKRISSKNKSGPFMGSEFAFEDISSQEIDKYNYKFLGDEELDGIKVFKSESYPAYKHSGYTRLISWIDAERLVPLKVEYYDRKNSLLKTLQLSDYQQYLDKFWRASKMEMKNEQSGKSTILEFADYKFQTGLSDADFSSKALKRFR